MYYYIAKDYIKNKQCNYGDIVQIGKLIIN